MADFVATFFSKAPPLFVTSDAMEYVAVFAPLLADQIDPLVTLVSPAAMSQLQRYDSITVRVTDPQLGFHCIFARFPSANGLYEVIYDGENLNRYGNYNVSRSAVTDGWDYTFSRKGGWPTRPIIRVSATDLGAGEIL